MDEEEEMTIKGWLFLTASWGLVTALLIYCFYNVLFGKGKHRK